MTGDEFIRRVRRLGRRRGVLVRWQRKRGKGSHGTLHFGDRRTVVGHRRRELKRGTLGAMLRQLGVKAADLDD